MNREYPSGRPEVAEDFWVNPSPPWIPSERPPTASTPTPPGWSRAELAKLSLSDLEGLIGQAERGDPKAIAAFQQFLENDGSAAWREVGDLADVAEKALVTKLFSGARGPAMAARLRFQEQRRELADDHATPLEKLAIERVLLASMFACSLDILIAGNGAAGLTSEKLLKAQLLAEKRFQQALRSLQTAREISRSAVRKPLRVFSGQHGQSDRTCRRTSG